MTVPHKSKKQIPFLVNYKIALRPGDNTANLITQCQTDRTPETAIFGAAHLSPHNARAWALP